jgi:hypothetical protein
MMARRLVPRPRASILACMLPSIPSKEATSDSSGNARTRQIDAKAWLGSACEASTTSVP